MADETEKPVPRDVNGTEVKAGDTVIWRELPEYEVRNTYLGCHGGRAVISPRADFEIAYGVNTSELEVVPPPPLDVAPPAIEEGEPVDVDAEGNAVVVLTGGGESAANHSAEIIGEESLASAGEPASLAEGTLDVPPPPLEAEALPAGTLDVEPPAIEE